MSQVLVVEDQPNLLRSLIAATTEAGFTVAGAGTLAEATKRIQKDGDKAELNLVILDIMLPDGNGLNWLKALRAAGNQVPVLLAIRFQIAWPG